MCKTHLLIVFFTLSLVSCLIHLSITCFSSYYYSTNSFSTVNLSTSISLTYSFLFLSASFPLYLLPHYFPKSLAICSTSLSPFLLPFSLSLLLISSPFLSSKNLPVRLAALQCANSHSECGSAKCAYSNRSIHAAVRVLHHFR